MVRENSDYSEAALAKASEAIGGRRQVTGDVLRGDAQRLPSQASRCGVRGAADRDDDPRQRRSRRAAADGFRISRHLGLPRSNVRRCLDVLVSEGVVRKVNEHGHKGELDWLASRIDAEYFVRSRDAIVVAADELKALDAPAA